MNSKQLISRDIELFYNKASEETRLEKGMGIFEFERIKSLIEKYIPSSTSVGLLNGLIHKKPFFDMCIEELTTGIHNAPYEFPWLLAEAYYHKPEQLKDEFINQGLTFLNTYAIEGMAWLDKNFFANMLDYKKKNTLLELLKTTENDNYLLPFSPHIMIAVQKQYTYGK